VFQRLPILKGIKMLYEEIENETGEEMRERIKIRDGKAKNEKPNDWINPAFYEYDN